MRALYSAEEQLPAEMVMILNDLRKQEHERRRELKTADAKKAQPKVGGYRGWA
jgi:hypothetical protein